MDKSLNKDGIVIEEGGMRFVFVDNYGDGCELCKMTNMETISCNMCKETNMVCVSVTKIAKEPRIYHAWDLEDARCMIGSIVEAHTGNNGHNWELGELEYCDTGSGAPFKLKGTGGWFRLIRNSTQIPMTWQEIKSKYGIGDDIVLKD